MQHAGKMRNLWLQQRHGSSDFLKPRAPYVFTDTEQADFLELVTSTRVPTSSTFIKHVGQKRLRGLKSHDHHCLLQQILPAAVRNSALYRGVKETIICLGHAFQRICSKVIDPLEIDELDLFVTETVCLLEFWFPLGFFDIMTHLVLHLVSELKQCGPVHARWYYGVERNMGVLTSYVRNRSKPEACMASGYMIDFALGFCIEYFALYLHSRRRIWDPDQDLKETGEVLMGAPTPRCLTASERLMIHDEYMALAGRCEANRALWRASAAPANRYNYLQELTIPIPAFSDWLYDHVKHLRQEDFPVPIAVTNLCCPPDAKALSYEHMWCRGSHYRCDPESGPCHVTFDARIAHITHETVETAIDVGILRSILLVTFGSMNVVLMKGSWICKTDEHNCRNIRRDRYGFWTI